jgi:hypothetical protein
MMLATQTIVQTTLDLIGNVVVIAGAFGGVAGVGILANFGFNRMRLFAEGGSMGEFHDANVDGDQPDLLSRLLDD